MLDIFLVSGLAFAAGFVDSIAGGGGLIQMPGLLWLFPNAPIITLLGTNKLASSCGTLMASLHYVRAFKMRARTIFPTLLVTFIFALVGAKIVTLINNAILKPLILIILILIGIYTLIKKDFGIASVKRYQGLHLKICCMLVGAGLGFYDGFLGAGTGSILVFILVGVLGYSFLEGSALAKLMNLASNFAALLIFAWGKHIIFKLGVPMALCNVLGNYFGSKLAIKKGSSFVRWIFIAVIIAMVVQFMWQIIH